MENGGSKGSGGSRMATWAAPVNIAVIKYWGKRDERLMVPLNDSISGTLAPEVMHATTTVFAGAKLEKTRMWLNQKEESLNGRVLSCIDEIKRRAAHQQTVSTQFLTYHINICSENNFPTAAGLASSAAGYACLVAALGNLYKIKGDLSSIARLGSGSACRSIMGGFVQWHAGVLPDGSDSVAAQITPPDHWPQMRVLIVVVSDDRKKTSSTKGMQDSVKSSDLLKYRASNCVPERVSLMRKAILEKDFNMFAEITMKDSNQFHAVCMDTYPPFVYMNPVSYAIVNLIHSYNDACGSNKIAYTFDAGPNACLYMLEDQIPIAYTLIKQAFPTNTNENVEYVKGIPIKSVPLPDTIKSKLVIEEHKSNLIKYLIHTSIGEGPYEIKDLNAHLLDEAGVPKFL